MLQPVRGDRLFLVGVVREALLGRCWRAISGRHDGCAASRADGIVCGSRAPSVVVAPFEPYREIKVHQNSWISRIVRTKLYPIYPPSVYSGVTAVAMVLHAIGRTLASPIRCCSQGSHLRAG